MTTHHDIEALAFDVRGPYALFRKPYAPVSPVSFPFPPPTAVAGLLGALCGMDRDAYPDWVGWKTLRVGVRLLAPTRLYRAAINLLNTKGPTDAYFRPRKPAHHMQIPHEFLADPAFRVFIAGGHPELLDRLDDSVERPHYQPVLGLASCLAVTSRVTRGVARAVHDATQVHSVVPVTDALTLEAETAQPVERLRVPAAMDAQRVVHRYQEIVVATDATPLRARGVEAYVLEGAGAPFTFI